MKIQAGVLLSALLALGLLAACSSGDSTTTDGGGPALDATTPQDAGGGFGSACNLATNSCGSGLVCTSTMVFNMSATPLCSLRCDYADGGLADGALCPPGASGASKCNMKGYCRP